ncbi:Sir2 family NAD-dependent protein deacetylase [Arthrobacter sp. KK5.5]|uniref:Sir2 family NAD-dependent protein deacetylase n=1 Tax=Arthrobacter sp. KK5.5 TaxID=3373084 RepID=UPI003EE7FF8D
MDFADLPIANAHRTAIRSIERVVGETAAPQDPLTALAGIASMLSNGPVLLLTGAGVSTDSGIPDYRGPNGSLRRHRPMTFQEFQHDPAARHRYWARSFVGWRHMAKSEPNTAHHSVAELERLGLLSGVVTQNVDGLHVRGGSRVVVPLHGDLDTVMCLSCGFVEDRAELDTRLAVANPGFVERIRLDPALVNPDGDVTLDQAHVDEFTMVGCLSCGSVELKPDVVYFGESVPVQRKADVRELEDKSTGLLVVGSSLAVMSGYRLVLDAEKSGKQIGIINGGPTRGDAKATWLWRTRVGPALDQLLSVVDAGPANPAG